MIISVSGHAKIQILVFVIFLVLVFI